MIKFDQSLSTIFVSVLRKLAIGAPQESSVQRPFDLIEGYTIAAASVAYYASNRMLVLTKLCGEWKAART